ncbi:MAG: glycosyl hydrolase [Acidimicrobiia bacterium]|nr:glycosyl hydrolase [Acidimicrobiia bacterium]
MSEPSTPASSNALLPHGNAICYSGYREGQSPPAALYPSHAEVEEDLLILARNWDYLRLYDSSRHAEIVLDVIERRGLDFKVLLGVDLGAELSNPDCPWGADYSDETLSDNRKSNDAQVDRAIELANRYSNIVFSVAVGNEAAVEWSDHLVSVDRLVSLARKVKRAVDQPVTSCDNYVPWTNKLKPLADELDFISVHTYPAWEHQTMSGAVEYTKENYQAVVDAHPDKPVVITEAGWTTASNGRGIEPANASEKIQAHYYEALLEWSTAERILTFVFEAFDEPWKGSSHPLEPEKHWGLFQLDRTPKLVMRDLYADLLA